MKNKDKLLQIIMWGVCVVLAIGLVLIVKMDQKKNAQRIMELQKQAAAEEQESRLKLEAQAEIYDEMIADLNINSIVCWGDSEMAGRNDNTLANALQDTVEDNLFESLKKTFGKAIQEGQHTSLGITINNMGVDNEGMRQILARAGVTSIEIGEWTQIPGDTDPVTLSLQDDRDWSGEDETLRFAKQRNVSFGKVWISDIEGTMVTTDNWYDSIHPRYAFVRNEEGDAKGVNVGATVEIESATKYLGDIPVLFFSDNTARSIDGFVSDIEELAYRYAGADNEEDTYVRPFVVICTAKEGSDLDQALINAFGSRYIRNDTYASEMTPKSYKSLAQVVVENLDEQGAFDSVKDRIARAIQEAEGL